MTAFTSSLIQPGFQLCFLYFPQERRKEKKKKVYPGSKKPYIVCAPKRLDLKKKCFLLFYKNHNKMAVG